MWTPVFMAQPRGARRWRHWCMGSTGSAMSGSCCAHPTVLCSRAHPRLPSRRRLCWFRGRAGPQAPTRKNVMDGKHVFAYFEVTPVASDELTELWADFVRGATLVAGLSLAPLLLILWSIFLRLKRVDRICAALRALAKGRQDARLPVFASPEMQEIAMSFNHMAERQAASNPHPQPLF